MTKISALASLTAAQADDVLPAVDIHDTSMAATGTTKKITLTNLLAVLYGLTNAFTGTNTFSGFTQFNAGLVLFSSTMSLNEGSNAYMGTVTLNGTTAVTVSTTAVSANSRIFLTTQAPAGTPGAPYVSSITAGTSFAVKSTSGTDTSTAAWLIVNHT